VKAFRPAVVIIDPISNLSLERSEAEVKPTLMRLIDFFKQQQITTLFTSLTTGGSGAGTGASTPEDSQVGVSSLMGTWLLLRNVESNGERNRMIFELKSRGMVHSNQMREFVLSDSGVDLVDEYPGADGVLTGNARVAHAAHEHASAEFRRRDHERNLLRLASRRKAIEAQIAALHAQGQAEEAEAQFTLAQDSWQETNNRQIEAAMAQRRSGGKTTEVKNKSRR